MPSNNFEMRSEILAMSNPLGNRHLEFLAPASHMRTISMALPWKGSSKRLRTMLRGELKQSTNFDALLRFHIKKLKKWFNFLILEAIIGQKLVKIYEK